MNNQSDCPNMAFILLDRGRTDKRSPRPGKVQPFRTVLRRSRETIYLLLTRASNHIVASGGKVISAE
jgi:hypothetical protein